MRLISPECPFAGAGDFLNSILKPISVMLFSTRAHSSVSLLLFFGSLVGGQQQCYFGPGADNRGPPELVPCPNDGQSSCCLLGDLCMSGNACWGFETGDTYQYGCTDITYTDDSCPYKCGLNTSMLTWTSAQEALADMMHVCLHG